MCWWVMTSSSMSSTACPRAASACSSSSSALAEFAPESTSVSVESSIRYAFIRPTMNGVGTASRWMPASAASASASRSSRSLTSTVALTTRSRSYPGGHRRADQREDLVAASLHVSGRDQRLQAQPQKRLGVRGPHVEVPVRVVDRDTVEAVLLGIRIALGDLLHLRVGV